MVKGLNSAKIVNEVQVVKRGGKGFFKRICEQLGFAQKEVQACSGKTINEIADMTSKKETLQYFRDTYAKVSIERANLLKQYGEHNAELRSMEKELHEARQKLERIKRSDYSDNFCGVFGDMSTSAQQKKLNDIGAVKELITNLEGRIKSVSTEDQLLAERLTSIDSKYKFYKSEIEKLEKLS